MFYCDSHTHSDNSFDAESSVDEMCRKALTLGLDAIAVTDHCEAPFIDCGENCEFGSFDRQIPKSVADARAAQAQYRGKLKVICGMELGEPTHDPAQTAKALAYGDFDFILASVHNLRGYDDFYYMDYSKTDVDALLRLYFRELQDTAAFPHFDSLAHLTYPLRYIVEREGYYPDLSKFQDEIDTIFKILIKNQKALEINVSGLFKDIRTTLPDESLVRRFRQLGGEYVTIGTDAHSTEMLGRGLQEGMAVAKRAGFDRYVYYEQHRPVFVDIT